MMLSGLTSSVMSFWLAMVQMADVSLAAAASRELVHTPPSLHHPIPPHLLSNASLIFANHTAGIHPIPPLEPQTGDDESASSSSTEASAYEASGYDNGNAIQSHSKMSSPWAISSIVIGSSLVVVAALAVVGHTRYNAFQHLERISLRLKMEMLPCLDDMASPSKHGGKPSDLEASDPEPFNIVHEPEISHVGKKPRLTSRSSNIS